MIPEAAVFTLIRSDAPAIETRITADDIRAKGDIGQTTLQEAIASRKPELAAWLVSRRSIMPWNINIILWPRS